MAELEIIYLNGAKVRVNTDRILKYRLVGRDIGSPVIQPISRKSKPGCNTDFIAYSLQTRQPLLLAGRDGDLVTERMIAMDNVREIRNLDHRPREP